MIVPVATYGIVAEKVRRLEQDLDAALTLLHVMSERMRQAFGSELVGPELCRFLSAFDPSEQRGLIARLDALAGSGDQPAAARLIRDLTGVTWDQAFAVYSTWNTFSAADKEKWVRSIQLRKALRSESDSLGL